MQQGKGVTTGLITGETQPGRFSLFVCIRGFNEYDVEEMGLKRKFPNSFFASARRSHHYLDFIHRGAQQFADCGQIAV